MAPPPLPPADRQPRSNKRRSSGRDDSPYSQDQSSSPSKKSRTSSLSQSQFSDRTKKRIRDASSRDDCWHCGADGKHVAHVIPKRAASSDFEYLRQAGMVNLGKLDEMNNGIPLCPNCHQKYDEDVPYWLFFPEDLDFFIDAERRDFNHRKHMWRHQNQIVARRPPTAQTYRDHQVGKGQMIPGAVWGSYRTFVVKVFKKPGGPDSLFEPGLGLLKSWHGDPMAALYHAFKATTHPGGLLIPHEFKQLARLYDDNDTEMHRLRTQAPTSIDTETHNDSSDSSDTDDDHQDDDKSPGDSRNSASHGRKNLYQGPSHRGQEDRSSNKESHGSRRHSKRIEGKRGHSSNKYNESVFVARDSLLVMLSPSSSSRKPKPMMQELFNRAVPAKRSRFVFEEQTDPGAQTTAQDRIDFFNFFNGGGYVDHGPWNGPVVSSKTEHGLLSPDESGGDSQLQELS
ncbi:MAG: hypothetical protein Q9220_006158 [cf. Caloplaca sp. 1 TL-2023]